MLTLLTLHSPGVNVLLFSDWAILMRDVGHDSRSTMTSPFFKTNS